MLQVLPQPPPDAKGWESTHTYLSDGEIWLKQVFTLPAFGVLCYLIDLKQGLSSLLKSRIESNHLKTLSDKDLKI